MVQVLSGCWFSFLQEARSPMANKALKKAFFLNLEFGLLISKCSAQTPPITFAGLHAKAYL
jgi:hypothetical protein